MSLCIDKQVIINLNSLIELRGSFHFQILRLTLQEGDFGFHCSKIIPRPVIAPLNSVSGDPKGLAGGIRLFPNRDTHQSYLPASQGSLNDDLVCICLLSCFSHKFMFRSPLKAKAPSLGKRGRFILYTESRLQSETIVRSALTAGCVCHDEDIFFHGNCSGGSSVTFGETLVHLIGGLLVNLHRADDKRPAPVPPARQSFNKS